MFFFEKEMSKTKYNVETTNKNACRDRNGPNKKNKILVHIVKS